MTTMRRFPAIVPQHARCLNPETRGNADARTSPRCGPRWTAGILGRLHRPRGQPHVAEIPSGNAGYLRHAARCLQGPLRGACAGWRNLCDGICRPAIRHGKACADHSQRLVFLPLDTNLRHGRFRRHDNRGHGAAGGQCRAFALRAAAHCRCGGENSRGKTRHRLRTACGNFGRADPARQLHHRHGCRRA